MIATSTRTVCTVTKARDGFEVRLMDAEHSEELVRRTLPNLRAVELSMPRGLRRMKPLDANATDVVEVWM